MRSRKIQCKILKCFDRDLFHEIERLLLFAVVVVITIRGVVCCSCCGWLSWLVSIFVSSPIGLFLF